MHAPNRADGEVGVTVAGWGLGEATDGGALAQFPVDPARYTAPEVIAAGPDAPIPFSMAAAADVWTLGAVLAVVWGGAAVLPEVSDAAEDVARLYGAVQGCGETLFAGLGFSVNAPDGLRDVVRQCLRADADARPSVAELLGHPWFGQAAVAGGNTWEAAPVLRSDRLVGDAAERKVAAERRRATEREAPFTAAELHYYWRLAGGTFDRLFARHEAHALEAPPILRIPRALDALMPDDVYEKLPAVEAALAERFEVDHAVESLSPLLGRLGAAANPGAAKLKQWGREPLRMREANIDYQLHRCGLFARLLAGLPETRDAVVAEARRDVPPLHRAAVWSCVVDEKPPAARLAEYTHYLANPDAERRAAEYQQIGLDLPRCHAEHAVLASPAGFNVQNEVLRVWLAANPRYAYWQGLDSLLAPFMTVSFDAADRAFGLLQAVIDRWLPNFFLPDNAVALQHHLASFKQVLSYIDPELSWELERGGFHPELYAIPWFLTLFSHALPLDKVCRLFDTLLLGKPSLPLFVAVALMQQLRPLLVPLDFNKCVAAFADMPAIDIDLCVRQTREFAVRTPAALMLDTRSKTDREFEPSPEDVLKAKREWRPADRLTVHIRRHELAPRCSLAVLSGSPVLIDTRPKASFEQVHHQRAKNVPASQIDEEGVVRAIRAKVMGMHVVVVSVNEERATKVANTLVAGGVAHVSVLQGGVKALLRGVPESEVSKAKRPVRYFDTGSPTTHPNTHTTHALLSRVRG